ncbi:hypothetical protein M434DRAFT_26818 [Hypoxylon sp. CO27-5]|nr:hypothetical protein M434DRAFT_26818 [Hypoxylon sp. CO27-5]
MAFSYGTLLRPIMPMKPTIDVVPTQPAILLHPIPQNEETRHRIPPSLGTFGSMATTQLRSRTRGEQRLCKYTRAILAAKTTEEEQLARLNCALVNLHLDRPEKALNEAHKAMIGQNLAALDQAKGRGQVVKRSKELLGASSQTIVVFYIEDQMKRPTVGVINSSRDPQHEGELAMFRTEYPSV